MHPHQHARAFVNDPENEREVLVIIDIIPVADYAPDAVLSRQPRLSHPVNEAFRLEAVGHQLRDGDERQPVLGGETLQLRPPCARSVTAKHLAKNASGRQASESREIDRRFGVTNALQNASIARSHWRNVSRAPQVGWNGGGINRDADRFRPVLRTHTSSHAKALISIYADGEGRAKLLGVHLGLLRQLELVGTLSGESEADPAARFSDHEVDQLGRNQLGRTNQVAFVLAVFVIRDDDELTSLDVGYRPFNRSKWHDSMLQRKIDHRSGNRAFAQVRLD